MNQHDISVWEAKFEREWQKSPGWTKSDVPKKQAQRWFFNGWIEHDQHLMQQHFGRCDTRHYLDPPSIDGGDV